MSAGQMKRTQTLDDYRYIHSNSVRLKSDHWKFVFAMRLRIKTEAIYSRILMHGVQSWPAARALLNLERWCGTQLKVY